MELLVRAAVPTDKDDLAEISRNTWEGDDYLEKTTESWLEDSGFYVGELSGKVVACGKITRMPGGVAWLEGLRVHPEFQGKGFGRTMSEKVLQEALRLQSIGRYHEIEFSTYMNNLESRAIAFKQGFRITELFHVLSFENPSMKQPPVQVKKTGLLPEDLSIYLQHAPCGWKYPHSSVSETAEWMADNAEFWQTAGGARFLTARRGFEISPLASSLLNPVEFVRGAHSLVLSKGMDYTEMMVSDSHFTVLKAALEAGFSYWEEPGAANILINRFQKKSGRR